MEWSVQRPEGKSHHGMFSSRLSLAGEYGERREVVREMGQDRQWSQSDGNLWHSRRLDIIRQDMRSHEPSRPDSEMTWFW